MLHMHSMQRYKVRWAGRSVFPNEKNLYQIDDARAAAVADGKLVSAKSTLNRMTVNR